MGDQSCSEQFVAESYVSNALSLLTRITRNEQVKVTVQFTLEQASPEREQMYSSILSSTSALDVGGWSTPRPRRFTTGKDPVPIV